MDYRVVYDVTEEFPAIWFPAVGLLFVAIGIALWHRRREAGFPWRWSFAGSPLARTLFAGFYLGFSVIWTVVSTVSVVGFYERSHRALTSGSADVVEGEVQDFHPMPPGGHDTERFTVRGVHFAYSDYVVGAGFNHTSSHGGPIREGLYVRIHYRGGAARATILKLEIRE